MPFSTRRAALETLSRNWAAIILALAIILGSAAANWRYEVNVSNHLSALRGGLCKIVHHSNQIGLENKHALLATAARAETRAGLDEADGHRQAAQADLDAAHLYRKFASEITPTTLDGCS